MLFSSSDGFTVTRFSQQLQAYRLGRDVSIVRAVRRLSAGTDRSVKTAPEASREMLSFGEPAFTPAFCPPKLSRDVRAT